MAGAPSLKNNLSLAAQNPSLNPVIIAGNTTKSASGDEVQGKLTNLSLINAMQYPSSLPKYYMSILIQDYARTNLSELGKLNTISYLTLPLPQQIVNALNIDYEETPIGAVLGAGINAVAGSGQDAETKEYMDSQTKNQQSADSGVVGKVGEIGTALFSAASGTAGDAARAFTGYTPNQFLTILMKGPKYKRHDFSWKFSPNSPGESKMLNRILKHLQEYSSPGLSSTGALFTFPKIFQLKFVPNQKYMYRFKPAVLEAIAMNYTPAGVPSFHRGFAPNVEENNNAPESIEVRMSFLELEFWLSGRGQFLLDSD